MDHYYADAMYVVLLFGEAMSKIKAWLIAVGLTLAAHKAESVLIIRRHVSETVAIKVDGIKIILKPCVV